MVLKERNKKERFLDLKEGCIGYTRYYMLNKEKLTHTSHKS